MEETGDGVLFDSKGQVLVGTDKVAKVGLIVDADDISEKPYGSYHTRKHAPLDAQRIKNRKVED